MHVWFLDWFGVRSSFLTSPLVSTLDPSVCGMTVFLATMQSFPKLSLHLFPTGGFWAEGSKLHTESAGIGLPWAPL